MCALLLRTEKCNGSSVQSRVRTATFSKKVFYTPALVICNTQLPLTSAQEEVGTTRGVKLRAAATADKV